MKNYDILILATFPAPYRVEIFNLLAKKFNIIVFWENKLDGTRDANYYSNNFLFDSYNLLDADGKLKFKEVNRNLKKFKLYLAYDYYLKNSIITQLKCKRKNIPYVINSDGAFIKKRSYKDILKKYLIKNARFCFASGDNAKKYFLYYGAKKENIAIHNFSSLFKNEILLEPVSIVEKEKYKKSLNLPSKTTFISIGQFIERKGFNYLIDAWSNINDNNVQLLIIGGGPLKKDYLECIKQRNIKNIYILDYLDHSKILEYYKASDYFILPTLEDIWGLVINEAMAYGLPVITTDKCIAGLELLKKSNGGIIVKSASSLELQNGIKEILKKNYNEMSLSNLNCIRDYTYESVAQSHIQVINEIIGEENDDK